MPGPGQNSGENFVAQNRGNQYHDLGQGEFVLLCIAGSDTLSTRYRPSSDGKFHRCPRIAAAGLCRLLSEFLQETESLDLTREMWYSNESKKSSCIVVLLGRTYDWTSSPEAMNNVWSPNIVPNVVDRYYVN